MPREFRDLIPEFVDLANPLRTYFDVVHEVAPAVLIYSTKFTPAFASCRMKSALFIAFSGPNARSNERAYDQQSRSDSDDILQQRRGMVIAELSC
jgi:hypothetical protein